MCIRLALSPAMLLAAACFLTTQSDTLAADPTVKLIRDDEGRAVAFEASALRDAVVQGLLAKAETDRNYSALFTVSVLADQAEIAPMLGRYEMAEHTLKFVPRFPLRAGLVYRAV